MSDMREALISCYGATGNLSTHSFMKKANIRNMIIANLECFVSAGLELTDRFWLVLDLSVEVNAASPAVGGFS